MNQYGELPKVLGLHKVDCKEMLFYQYLPIKLAGQTTPRYEERLKCFDELIGAILCDYVAEYGLNAYVAANIYLTAKYMFQPAGCSYNRPGWHSDGFMTDDINYIWSDKYPTVFCQGEFKLTQDDQVSLQEMEEQAKRFVMHLHWNNGTLLRLNQFAIHKAGTVEEPGMRTFIKVSFSKDKYDLEGNAHNYLLDYNWPMKPRSVERNIPQSNMTFDSYNVKKIES